ncbi:Amino acid permease 6 [Forsythia ovata]|uniref:Amino acid permease 6 n=1 Tax=Forsythia ovata TaxID=205694 RepID=A0ABD1VIP6_9LAMI
MGIILSPYSRERKCVVESGNKEEEAAEMIRDTKFGIETGNDYSKFDDDGRVKRTGTLVTTSAHIITAVIGSGVLSLAWAIAQLGWIAGPIALVGFSLITWFTSLLLADCNRSEDGKRNYTYMDVVKSNLGGMKIQLCGIAQYSNLIGISIGYSITTSISMVAIKRSNCFHKLGQHLSVLSLVAAVMSFAYSSIGFALSIAKVAGGGGHVETGLTGIPIGENQSSVDKMWNTYSALGNIAFAYAFSTVLVEIQDTVKSGPSENKVMKKATLIAILISTLFYMLCGLLGYAAFGDKAPGNFLTGFGFYNPFWLVDLANLCIVVHLLGAYQVFCQPIFAFVERWSSKKWAGSNFITKEYSIGMPFCGSFNISFFRLVWRTTYVIFTTILAMLFPFFNDFVGLLGAASFWPLTVYFPIEMYISKAKIPKFSFTWIWMQILSLVCLTTSLLAAAGSIRGLIKSLQTFKAFHSVS